MRKLVFGATLSMLVFQASPVFAQAGVAIADPVGPLTCATSEGRSACDDEATRTEKLFQFWGNGYTPSREFMAKVEENQTKTREARMHVEHERRIASEEAQADARILEYCSASGLEPNCLEGRLEILNGD